MLVFADWKLKHVIYIEVLVSTWVDIDLGGALSVRYNVMQMRSECTAVSSAFEIHSILDQ